MTKTGKQYIFENTSIRTLSVYDLLKYTVSNGFTENPAFHTIIALVIENNAGVFTKKASVISFPEVTVSQAGSSLISSCSCDHTGRQLCGHQAEVIWCILEQQDYRVFFDDALRRQLLLPVARTYGLENEPDLEAYFYLEYQDGKTAVRLKRKELLPGDAAVLKRSLLPQRPSLLKELAAQDTDKQRLLVIGQHRYYHQLNFLLMEAALTRGGKLRNPVANLDPMPLVWKATHPAEIKFYTGIVAFQHKYHEEHSAAALDTLKQIVQNPLGLDVYYHNRDLSENIAAKSLIPVALDILKTEIRLSVFKKDPFYEITGGLLLHDRLVPFKELIIRDDYFVYSQNKYSLIDDPDMLRVIRFFKSNNEILLVHASKYEAFLPDVLSPLEQYVHIDYSYIRPATPVQLAEQEFRKEPLIYLNQEGNFVSITPVMKYGLVEVPVYSRKQLFDTDPNGNLFRIERDTEAEVRLASRIMRQHPDFKEQIGGHEYFYLHRDRFLDDRWFLEAFETWRKEGITILGFNELKQNKRNPHRARITVRVTSGVDWFNARLNVRFGNQEASLKQLHRAIRNKRRFVLLDDGTEGVLPDEWIDKIAAYFQAGVIDDLELKIPKVRFSGIAALFEKEVLSAEVQEEIAGYERQFSAMEHLPPVIVPPGLNARLRGYQQEGLNWLAFLDGFNFGGCLADDMGLGKTLQIIAFILLQRERYGHTTNLVVVPTSLLFNWQQEIATFAPSVSVLLHYGPDRQKNIGRMQQHEVVLTSYGVLLSDIRFLKTFGFNYIFLDESQAIKNPDSERYKAARLLQSRNRIVLTGTPLENNTFDLYGQLSFACPGLLGSKQYFKDTYAIPIDKFEYRRRAAELQQKIKPFILRRTKKQVATELPEKTEMVIYCEMDAVQRNVYVTYERELRAFVAASDEDTIHKNSMHVLKGLTRLRQICNSPALLGEGYSGEHAVKIQVLVEGIGNRSGEHKILVFSQFVGMLELIKEKLEQMHIPFEYLTGQTRDRRSRVHQFRTDGNIRVFLISLKAGGVGLNLTEADYVYVVDPWWNPAAENQAIDRCYRIGQAKHVIAVRLICSNTVEEKIQQLQKRKNQLAQDLVKTDGSELPAMSRRDLLEILE